MDNLTDTVCNESSRYNGTNSVKSIDIGFYCYYYGIFFVITLVNLCGNSLILVSARRKNLRIPENYFIFSLAVSDILYGVTFTLYNIVHMDIPAVKLMTSKQWRIGTIYKNINLYQIYFKFKICIG